MSRSTIDLRLRRRRAARIAFGRVLLAGAAVLVATAFDRGCPAWRILLGTWVAAGVAAGGAWIIEPRRLARPDDEAASFALPAAGIALLLPLTIHLPFVIGLDGPGGFRVWVTWSIGLVGFAHFLLAVMVARRARQLVAGEPVTSARRIYGSCVMASFLPGAFLVVPPVLTALTGLLILPLIVHMERLVERERVLAGPRLPRARALP